MIDLYKQLALSQLQAALCTLNTCIEKCPEPSWNAKVANLAFCQVAFHTLFYTDLYLDQNVDSFGRQPFHQVHGQSFRDYEEFQDRDPIHLYERGFIKTYVQHCRDKAPQVIAAETLDSLNARCGFPWQSFSRAEVHVYNTRHIQHHAAQLSLRLRLDLKHDTPWVRSGWRER